jgi:rhodanese-related sulfurtransferase
MTAPPAAAALDGSGLPVGYPYKPDFEITPREVKAAMDRHSPAVVLIDCRTQGEWQTARIEGATLIPLDQIASKLEDIEALAPEGAMLVVHCHHGVRSLRATLALRQHGLSARSMAGGIDLWSIDVDPRVPRY